MIAHDYRYVPTDSENLFARSLSVDLSQQLAESEDGPEIYQSLAKCFGLSMNYEDLLKIEYVDEKMVAVSDFFLSEPETKWTGSDFFEIEQLVDADISEQSSINVFSWWSYLSHDFNVFLL